METNTIGQIAWRIIGMNYPYYGYDLLDLIPAWLKEIDILRIQEGQMIQIMHDLDSLRFHEEAAWSKTNRISEKTLTKKLNSPIGSLPFSQEKRRRRIKFLFNVCSTAIHF